MLVQSLKQLLEMAGFRLWLVHLDDKLWKVLVKFSKKGFGYVNIFSEICTPWTERIQRRYKLYS